MVLPMDSMPQIITDALASNGLPPEVSALATWFWIGLAAFLVLLFGGELVNRDD